jgi:hypothetical protein
VKAATAAVGGDLSNNQRTFIKQRVAVEHRQELACIGYLNDAVVIAERQRRLEAQPVTAVEALPVDDSIDRDRRPDVVEKTAEQVAAEKKEAVEEVAAQKALRDAAWQGDLATLKRLVEERVNVNATDGVSAAPPTTSQPPPPIALRPFATYRPCCPVLTVAAHSVWRRLASAGRLDGPHVGG